MTQYNTYSTDGWPLGIDWSSSPEHIDDKALVQAENCEYDHADGCLRTVEGVVIKLEAGIPVDTLFYDHINGVFLFSSGTSLYSTNLETKTYLGELIGSSKPIYTIFGDTVLIASGGLLQALSGAKTLTTVTGSPPISHFVTGRQGRVIAFSNKSDVLNYSAIGNYSSWTNVASDPSSGQFLDVGYKDPGNIIAVDFLSKVLIVYKQYGRCYQVIGNPQSNDFACLPLSQTASCLSTRATCNVDDKSYYLGQGGFMALVATDTYSNIEPFEAGVNINAWVAKNIDCNCALWHLQSRKQIWMKAQTDNRVYLYHYLPRYKDGKGAWTTRKLTYDLHDVCEVENKTYIAYGNKIGILSKATDLDDEEQIQTSIIGNNKLAAQHNLVLMNWKFVSNNAIYGYGIIKCGKKTKNVTFSASSPLVYGNTSKIYGNIIKVFASDYTALPKVGGGAPKSVQLSVLVQKGAISIRQFDYTYIEV